jgi:AraC-like DNA-binding protein
MIFDFANKPSDSPLVDFVWKTVTDGETESFMSTAGYHSELVVTKQYGKINLSIRGPETKASPSDVPENAEFFGIVLKLGAYMPKLPPINLLDNNSVHLQESSYNSIWLGSAWQIPTYENVDTFISRLVREGLLVYDPLVSAVMEERPLDLSLRTVQRRFLQATGLSPVTIRQIYRAQQAMNLLQEGVSILDTVTELNYSDQAHLTRSLKQFMGQTPAQVSRGLPLNNRSDYSGE